MTDKVLLWINIAVIVLGLIATATCAKAGVNCTTIASGNVTWTYCY